MPRIVSGRQFRFMQVVAHGSARNKPKGLSAESARRGIMELSSKKRSRFAKGGKRRFKFPSERMREKS